MPAHFASGRATKNTPRIACRPRRSGNGLAEPVPRRNTIVLTRHSRFPSTLGTQRPRTGNRIRCVGFFPTSGRYMTYMAMSPSCAAIGSARFPWDRPSTRSDLAKAPCTWCAVPPGTAACRKSTRIAVIAARHCTATTRLAFGSSARSPWISGRKRRDGEAVTELRSRQRSVRPDKRSPVGGFLSC